MSPQLLSTMNNDGTSGFSFFVGEHIEPIIDQVIVDNDKLSKQGRLGKFIARHRATSICVVVAIFMIGCGALIWWSGSYFFGSLRLIAAGVQYRFGERELPHDSVRLPSGLVVDRVIEPREAISNHYHALLLYEELLQKKPLTTEDVQLGYARWEVTRNEDRAHNFTFTAAKQLAQRLVGDKPCLCYLQLGLPYNIVLMGSEVLYEPIIENDAHTVQIVKWSDRGDLFRLIDSARVYVESSRQPPPKIPVSPANVIFSTADRGVIQYITEKAAMRRRVIDDEKAYPCIKHCIHIYQLK